MEEIILDSSSHTSNLISLANPFVYTIKIYLESNHFYHLPCYHTNQSHHHFCLDHCQEPHILASSFHFSPHRLFFTQ